ncbi:hypothetical protein MNEG_9921 [Monoraphidium neglectum]|uniref:Uncharacterized protein n=1 Tax=Monoraphidium neglectum TaxID=145388 RepID=A0A0D2JES7_9CHLO|nr:hypothetical protein MNEG_9921 [Monoraphidium neglectum]KIY98037.1 hypothetical protein MNEG_9921 [Monoraphidium neglectum]|eukprot:XP_013897057.1 hypothetical protein MNEG_9921 [Monoraphidium neglectum]
MHFQAVADGALIAPCGCLDVRATPRVAAAAAAAAAPDAAPPPALPRLRRLCVAQASPALARLAPRLRVVDLRSSDVGLSHLAQCEPHCSVEELCIGPPAIPCTSGYLARRARGRPGGDAAFTSGAPAPLLAFAHLPGPGSFPTLSRLRLRGGGALALQLLSELGPFAGPRLRGLSVEWAAADGPAPLARALRALLPLAGALEALRVEVFAAGAPPLAPARAWDDAALAALAFELLGVRPRSLRRVDVVLPPGAVWDPALGGACLDGASWAGCVRLMGHLPWLHISEGRGGAGGLKAWDWTDDFEGAEAC